MNPAKIFDVLDLTLNARSLGRNFIPLFTGPAGVGKSSVCQQWVKKQKETREDFGFIDLRAAYLENCDLIGFPTVSLLNNRQVTSYNPPDFLPSGGAGLLLLEEPNRGTTSVMNTFMQLLTDRKIHKYELPPGWIIAACINPENEHYDVNAMDAALKNRFEIFDVDYDKHTFVEYMKVRDFDKNIVMFVESNTWTFSKPETLGDSPMTKYISPRTFEKLDTAIKAGLGINAMGKLAENTLMVFESILGKGIGKAFYAFTHNEKPILIKNLIENQKAAIAELKAFSNPNEYKNNLISITVSDMQENHELVTDELLAAVTMVIPADQGMTLIRELEYVKKDHNILQRLIKNYPKLKELFKNTINKD